MRHRRYHSKHVLPPPVRPFRAPSRRGRRPDERIVASWFTLYIADRETTVRRPGAAPGGAMRRKPAKSAAIGLPPRRFAAPGDTDRMNPKPLRLPDETHG